MAAKPALARLTRREAIGKEICYSSFRPAGARWQKVEAGFSRKARSKFLESITFSALRRFRLNAA